MLTHRNLLVNAYALLIEPGRDLTRRVPLTAQLSETMDVIRPCLGYRDLVGVARDLASGSPEAVRAASGALADFRTVVWSGNLTEPTRS
jgi:hypothetical protein